MEWIKSDQQLPAEIEYTKEQMDWWLTEWECEPPKESEWVIGARGSNLLQSYVKYHYGSNEWHMYGDYLTSTVEVTHWCPLPDPPTSGEQ